MTQLTCSWQMLRPDRWRRRNCGHCSRCRDRCRGERQWLGHPARSEHGIRDSRHRERRQPRGQREWRRERPHWHARCWTPSRRSRSLEARPRKGRTPRRPLSRESRGARGRGAVSATHRSFPRRPSHRRRTASRRSARSFLLSVSPNGKCGASTVTERSASQKRGSAVRFRNESSSSTAWLMRSERPKGCKDFNVDPFVRAPVLRERRNTDTLARSSDL